MAHDSQTETTEAPEGRLVKFGEYLDRKPLRWLVAIPMFMVVGGTTIVLVLYGLNQLYERLRNLL